MTKGDDEHDDALFVSDRELTRRLGVGEKKVRVAIQELEKHPSFPKKDRLFGKRYWPAVKAFLDRRSGITVGRPAIVPDGKENPPNEKAQYRRRARPGVA